MGAEIQAAARVLSEIPVNRSWRETPKILLSGEIFVRHDGISRQHLPETLARKGFAVKVSSAIEWIYYTDWCVQKRLSSHPLSPGKRIYQKIRNACMKQVERTFRKILVQTGLCSDRNEDVDHIIQRSRHLISPHLVGEAILTTGAAITEILDPYCGVIAVGPFGCMPNRLSEAILNCEMNIAGKRISGNGNKAIARLAQSLEEHQFLAIETDGNPFPPILQARLEAFLLQSSRIHEVLSRVSADP
jgi:predicted nucleotide-binding protein (sugar kinase/HSP70/actin superfamily)